MAWRWPIAGVAICSLVACSDGGTGSQATSKASQSASTQPAQTAPAAPVQQQVGAVVEKMEIDLEKRLVFLPNEGWLNEDDFWHIYYNEPHRLPGTVDVDGLHELGYRPSAAEEPGGGA